MTEYYIKNITKHITNNSNASHNFPPLSNNFNHHNREQKQNCFNHIYMNETMSHIHYTYIYI